MIVDPDFIEIDVRWCGNGFVAQDAVHAPSGYKKATFDKNSHSKKFFGETKYEAVKKFIRDKYAE